MRDYLKFYRLSGATFYDCINTIYQFMKPFFDNKMSIFEEFGAFNVLSWRSVNLLTHFPGQAWPSRPDNRFKCTDQKKGFANSIDPDVTALTCNLIWIYTVCLFSILSFLCHFVIDFCQRHIPYCDNENIHITKTRLFKYIENFTSKN